MTETGMVQRAAHEAEDRRGHRLLWAFVAMTCVGLVVLTVALLVQGSAIGDLRTEASDNGRDARALARQVEQLGGTPVVQPPPTGEPGANGANGADGRDGVDGRDGKDGQDGEPGADGTDGSDGPPGPDGPPGSTGPAGQDGVTPPCMAEPAQCRGADGGDGQDGAQGPQGPPGPTCPAGYTPASRTYDPTPVLPGDEETWWVCVADEGQA